MVSSIRLKHIVDKGSDPLPANKILTPNFDSLDVVCSGIWRVFTTSHSKYALRLVKLVPVGYPVSHTEIYVASEAASNLKGESKNH